MADNKDENELKNMSADTNLNTNAEDDVNTITDKDISENVNTDDKNQPEQKDVLNGQIGFDDEPYEISSSQAMAASKETAAETSTVIDNVMSDKDKVITVVGALLFVIGSYINFWCLYRSDLGIMNQGNLFAGYMWGGVLGKLLFILALVSIVLIFLDKVKYNWFVSIAFSALFVLQVALIIIFGRLELGGSNCTVVPGIGFFICLICIGLNLIFSRKLYKKGK